MADARGLSKPVFPRIELIFLAIVLVFQISILYSLFALSLSMIALGVLALVSWHGERLSLRLNVQLLKQLLKYWTYPIWWIISLHFFIVFFGGFYSDDTAFWLSRIRIKLPFLFLPMAFFLIPSISRRSYQTVHYLLALVMTLSTIPILIDILGDPGGILERLAQGQAIETPISHIRYSLLIALASVASLILYVQKFTLKYHWEVKLLLGLSVYLFVFAHLLAVRSGLLALYVTFFILALIGISRRVATKQSIFLLTILVVSPVISFLTIPSLKTKVAYTIRDIRQFQEEDWNSYSDAERLLSVQGGLTLATENKWFGIGPGDLRGEMKTYFLTELDKTTFLLPHNQYISLLAGSGIVGLLLFFLALFLPMIRFVKSPLFLALNLIILPSMLVENTLETSAGVAIYIFYLGCALNYFKDDLSQFKLSRTILHQKTE